jgi:hypothetical protein
MRSVKNSTSLTLSTTNLKSFIKNSVPIFLLRHGTHCFKTIRADENSINLDGGRKITIFSFMAVFLSIKQLF